MIRKEAVMAVLGSPVAYYAAFAQALGGVEAGVFASQFFYWHGKGHDPDGWVYKTQAEIEEETGLTRRNQETARGGCATAACWRKSTRACPPSSITGSTSTCSSS